MMLSRSLKNLVNLPKTPSNKRVKILRSENSPEFEDKKCRLFCNNLRVMHLL